jgi:hypothetical protein
LPPCTKSAIKHAKAIKGQTPRSTGKGFIMFKTTVTVLTILTLSACGGTRYASSNARVASTPAPVQTFDAITGEVKTITPVALPFATGPIYSACQSDGRKAASRARCGCVQAVADQSLSTADQNRGTRYFKDPGALQEVRQSDNTGNERFWLAWKAFGQAAAAQCKGS